MTRFMRPSFPAKPVRFLKAENMPVRDTHDTPAAARFRRKAVHPAPVHESPRAGTAESLKTAVLQSGHGGTFPDISASPVSGSLQFRSPGLDANGPLLYRASRRKNRTLPGKKPKPETGSCQTVPNPALCPKRPESLCRLPDAFRARSSRKPPCPPTPLPLHPPFFHSEKP